MKVVIFDKHGNRATKGDSSFSQQLFAAALQASVPVTYADTDQIDPGDLVIYEAYDEQGKLKSTLGVGIPSVIVYVTDLATGPEELRVPSEELALTDSVAHTGHFVYYVQDTTPDSVDVLNVIDEILGACADEKEAKNARDLADFGFSKVKILLQDPIPNGSTRSTESLSAVLRDQLVSRGVRVQVVYGTGDIPHQYMYDDHLLHQTVANLWNAAGQVAQSNEDVVIYDLSGKMSPTPGTQEHTVQLVALQEFLTSRRCPVLDYDYTIINHGLEQDPAREILILRSKSDNERLNVLLGGSMSPSFDGLVDRIYLDVEAQRQEPF